MSIIRYSTGLTYTLWQKGVGIEIDFYEIDFYQIDFYQIDFY